MKIIFLSFLILLVGLVILPSFAQIEPINPQFPPNPHVVKIFPIDDIHSSVANLYDPTLLNFDEQKDIGNAKFLRSWYAYNVTGKGELVTSKLFLQFDLSDAKPGFINANLRLMPWLLQLNQTKATISVYSTDNSNWTESEFSINNEPQIKDRLSTSTFSKPYVFQGWDVTEFIKENIGSNVTLAVSFDKFVNGYKENVVFYSKENSKESRYPYLELIYYPSDFDGIMLNPTDDAFVAANLTDPNDIEGYKIANTGDLDFLKSWYAWNVTEHQEQLFTNTYLKFDLSKIESDKIANANLKLSIKAVNTPDEKLPKLDLISVSDNDWNESTITFLNAPLHDNIDNFVTSTIIDDKWYLWNITDLVRKHAGSKLSLVFAFSDIYDNTEEVVSFHSKETTEQDKAPVLEIEYTSGLPSDNSDKIEVTDLESQNNEGGGCLIATATYGTELSPQVQQLRELRDNTLLQTESGSFFMESFNHFYYSFSPTVADLERQNPIFKETVKLMITPMLSSLSMLNYADIDSESEMMGYGLGVIALNLAMYAGLPAVLVYKARK